MSTEKKKELQVAALENGTAIDHIPSCQLFKVASLLGLDKMDNTITIGIEFAAKRIESSQFPNNFRGAFSGVVDVGLCDVE